MSRSFRKHLIGKVTDKFAKKYANKVVRHKQDLPDYHGYKRAFCSYNIIDQRWNYYSYIREFTVQELYRAINK